MTQPGARARRGRPPAAERPPLDHEQIARAALRVAGEEGFPALTMRRLAEELGVTPRALYNCVKDRQEVVDLTARLMMDGLPRHVYDPADWRATMRRVYHEARAYYRAAPRAALISLDERVTPGELHPARLEQPEEMLAFLSVIGLGLEDAIRVRGRLLQDVFAYVLLIDYRYDRGEEPERALVRQPVPAPWLDAHPGLDLPHARAAAELPPLSSDEYFDQFVDDALTLIEHKLRPGGGDAP